MVDKLLSLPSAVALLAIVITGLGLGRLMAAASAAKTKSVKGKDLLKSSSEPTALGRSLSEALPGSVLFPRDGDSFKQSAEHHWAQQASEVVPACIVRPRDTEELSRAVRILNGAAGGHGEMPAEGLFAVRSGGHSWVTGASSIDGGTLIDLSLLCEVKLSEDKSSVVIGSGAKWGDVSKILDGQGLAVLGGRNSDVGVGGFLLGGGISFLSPRFGLACSNIISYEVVLASGAVVLASESSKPDLWRALKGGSNNFGIVTRFTVRSFPQGNIWAGYIYLPSFQSTKILSAFHDFLQRSRPGNQGIAYDENAAGPMACFSYVHPIRMEIICVHLAYIKTLGDEKEWPSCWKKSSFSSFWRYWSTCKTRTLTNATDELEILNPRGKRQQETTLTIKNDPATLAAAYAIYKDASASLRRAGVKGLVWTLVIQPLIPDWLHKGYANPMGLDSGGDEPLVVVLYLGVWDDWKDDELVCAKVRSSTEKLEAVAVANGTFHPYKYLNYCGDGQRPLQGYGEEGLQLLREVSKKYDPDGMFQKQCIGGFKLGVDAEA